MIFSALTILSSRTVNALMIAAEPEPIIGQRDFFTEP